MRTLSVSVFAIFCGLAFAQDSSDVFDKAPPAIDEALRARVDAFYQAHVDGKFRQADQYVAEDSKDAFFEADKPHYKGCRIAKISYRESFTKATVVMACKNEVAFHGERVPVTMPATSYWKMDGGLWWWYFVQESEVQTPFGVMKAGPENNSGPPQMPSILKDPAAAARNILAQVTVDPVALTIDQTRSSKHEIHIKNGMPGAITVSVDPTGVPGLTFKPVKPQIAAGEEGVVVVDFNFDDPAILCQECLVHPGVRPPATVSIHIDPTTQRFPIQIAFSQPEQKK